MLNQIFNLRQNSVWGEVKRTLSVGMDHSKLPVLAPLRIPACPRAQIVPVIRGLSDKTLLMILTDECSKRSMLKCHLPADRLRGFVEYG